MECCSLYESKKGSSWLRYRRFEFCEFRGAENYTITTCMIFTFLFQSEQLVVSSVCTAIYLPLSTSICLLSPRLTSASVAIKPFEEEAICSERALALHKVKQAISWRGEYARERRT